jgi:hypothetical protein
MVGGQRTTLYQKFGLSSTKTVGLPEFWYDFIFPKYFIVFKNYKLLPKNEFSAERKNFYPPNFLLL